MQPYSKSPGSKCVDCCKQARQRGHPTFGRICGLSVCSRWVEGRVAVIWLVEGVHAWTWDALANYIGRSEWLQPCRQRKKLKVADQEPLGQGGHPVQESLTLLIAQLRSCYSLTLNSCMMLPFCMWGLSASCLFGPSSGSGDRT
jgi:hypothetical protein